MEPTRIAKQMMDFQKSTFNSAFDAAVMLQDQTERVVNSFTEQITKGFAEESKKVMKEWADAYKKGREDFKKNVDEGFKTMEDFFGVSNRASKTKKENVSE